ncbi:host attachment protein [Desulfurispira natronophila]|uniref:Protein required for attachment to host cells n=1 Tax=Desulfurispira natronophila TaxID=682562 RepID=A0A7W8DH17_9BACT|nr:host attachment protein [Desulfurispira natronophila]MBB5021917.1 protein required for attachment to host cells [Desulfurispira natronophila]
MNTPHFQMPKTLILVANASRARLFTVESPTGPLRELESRSHPASQLRQQDLTSDRHGRSFQSAGESRSAMSQSVDPKEQEAITFAKELADLVNHYRGQGELERLYLVAPPGFLGLLRKSLKAEVQALVAQEIDKDYTRLAAPDLRSHLPEFLR